MVALDMRASIQQIDEDVVKYLAASEVVDHTLSIVKELVDNAIDAKATQVAVRILRGGQNGVVVSDDGHGIPKEDLPLAIKKHFSSKTRSLDDALSPAHLGFRGEALHSIQAVANLKVTSKIQGDDHAWSLSCGAGEAGCKLLPASGKVGTTVETGPIFERIPARRSSLPSARSDSNKIAAHLRKVAVSNPHLLITLKTEANSELFTTGGRSQTLRERCSDVFGPTFIDEATDIKLSFWSADEEWMLTGIVRPLKPGKKANQTRCVLTVNKCMVNRSDIETQIKRVWKSVFSISNVAFEYVLKLSSLKSTKSVNFNCHPRKEEVSFFRQPQFFRDMNDALAAYLREKNSSTVLSGEVKKGDVVAVEIDLDDDIRRPLGRPLAQYKNGYILSEVHDGILLIDQHAAHERIIFENMKSGISQGDLGFSTRRLASPVLVSEDIGDQAELEAFQAPLLELGIELRFDHNVTFILSVPVIDGMVLRTDEVLEKLLSGVASQGSDDAFTVVAMDLANKACKRAIKSTTSLSIEEMNGFLRMMEETPASVRCNHGRPTITRLPHSEIMAMFER